MADDKSDTGERRPIATREAAWSRALAAVLVRAGVSANCISVAGMIAGIASGLALAATAQAEGGGARWLWLAGAALIQLRLLANMLDGMVAIASGQASPVGQLYNEIPDRISDGGTLAGLGYAAGGDPIIGWIAVGLAIFVAYVRAQGKVAGAPHEFCGPMAKPHRMFAATVVSVFMACAPAAFQPSWGPGGEWGAAAIGLLIIAAGSALTAIRRLLRIARALRASGGNPSGS